MKNQNLSTLIEYAYRHVKYYHELFNKIGIDASLIQSSEDLIKIPILKKDTIQEQMTDFISDEYQKFPKNENVVIKRTSGSTGKYLKIYWDYKDDIKSLMPLWTLRSRLYGIDPKMKWCSFYSTRYEGNKIKPLLPKEVALNGRYMGFSKIGLTYKKIEDNYRDILEFNPDWLLLQPSIAYLMSQIVKEHNLPVPSNLKYIEMSGEYLFDNYKKQIEETFDVYTANQYGCNEANEIAYEFKCRNMHVIENNVIVEVLKDGKTVINEEGDIYVTSLKNFAMPFIRYQTGDRGILITDHNCSCKNKAPILKVNSGRSSDFLLLENGEKMNSYVLANIVEYTNENMSSAIKQFQITQTDINKFNVNLVVKSSYSGWKNAISECFLDNIQEEELKNAKWNFIFSDEICPDKNTGKFKYFINELI